MMSFKMASLLCLIFLLVITGALENQWSVKYSNLNLCAVKGSTVVMEATYTHPTGLTVNNRFWFIKPVYGVEPTDLSNESGYSGRVEYLGDKQNHFSLRLSDVKKSDEHMYCFRFITDKQGGYQGHPGITLSVTDLQVFIPKKKVTEGESVILTCKTTCSLTDPTFIWYKNTHDLTTNTFKSNELHLQRVSSEDAGSYRCAVKGYEHLPSPAQYLSVRSHQQKVSVSISPSAEIVEGTSVTLTCSCDLNPAVETYTWYKGTSSVGKGKTFTISKVSGEHSGEYKCKCSNEPEDQSSNSVTLIVLYPPKNVSVSISPSGEIEEGSSVTLTCSSDANPLLETFKWFKGTTTVGKGKTFTISKISSEYSGEYKCMCSNEVGNQNSSVTLNVLYPPKNVSVSTSPSGEIVEGSSVTLTCSSVDANPPVENYTWFKETKSVGKGKTFTISKISSEDSGKYKCMCSNKVGHQNSTSVTLNVLYPPKNISVSTSPSGEIVEGSSVTLICSSDANPPVETYTWFKGNTSVGNTKNNTIPRINSEDSGEYKCTGSNKFGNQTSISVPLNVLYPPKKVSVSISPSGEIVEGRLVNLSCSSDANPPVETYTWFKGKTSVVNGKTYTIPRIISKDSGEYKCMCSNKVGNQSSTNVTLNVLYPPKNISVFISPSGEIVEGSSVTLTCRSNANPPVENYTWFKRMTSVGKGKTFTISNTSSEHSGEYKCMCSNKVGHQNSTSVTLNVLYPPKNVSISPSGANVEGSSVTLTCSSDSNPPVETYTWFKENEASPVGSGQSYRALQSGLYYCEVQNKLGSERSAAVSITINALNGMNLAVYAGLVVVVCVCLIGVIILFKMKNKRTGSTVDQSIKQENLYENVTKNQVDPAFDSASANQDEALYAKVVRRAKDAESSDADASGSGEDEVQYASVRFINSGAEYRPSNAEDPSVIYSSVK